MALTFTDSQLQRLRTLATTYSLANGISYLPLPIEPSQTPPTQSAIHAPISLVPSSLPKELFNAVWDLQSVYNVLYSRIAADSAFLDDVLGGQVSEIDDFVGRLWRGWKTVRGSRLREQLHLGLFRSDYMQDTASRGMKQVEFNTISSSFGVLAAKVSAMHRYLAQSTSYYDRSPLLPDPSRYPPNRADVGLTDGIAHAHSVYCEEYLGDEAKQPVVLFVVQPNERNIFDQRALEYNLAEAHGIRVIRQSLTELKFSASLSAAEGSDPRLLVQSDPDFAEPEEVSVVYYRAGYTPTDYPTDGEWDARFLLERSRAVNCPTLPLHLAGSKKVQQVLTKPGILESFLSSSYPPETLESIRNTWVGIWGLEDSLSDGETVVNWISRDERYKGMVVKPQREGGGNNVYHTSIPSFLSALPEPDRRAWIVMELIRVPENVVGYLSRAQQEQVTKSSAVVSELGIFGWSLFRSSGEIVKETTCGHLVRTKDRGSDEGGVASGFAVVDSLLLV